MHDGSFEMADGRVETLYARYFMHYSEDGTGYGADEMADVWFVAHDVRNIMVMFGVKSAMILVK